MSRRNTRRKIRKQKQKTIKRRRLVRTKGGFFFKNKKTVLPEGCDNVSDINTSEDLQAKYRKCCYYKRSFFQEEPTFCKNIKSKLKDALINEEGVNCDFDDINEIKSAKSAHAHYLKCCPKKFHFFKNRSKKCKQLEAKYKELENKDEVLKFGKTEKKENMYYQVEPDEED